MESHSILLQGDNYAEWSTWMESDLVKRNLWSVVIKPGASRQEDVEVSSGDWEEKNYFALCLIRYSCGDEAKSKIRWCTSACDAWNILAEKLTMLYKDNFADWAILMKSHLIAQNLWRAIDHWHEDGESYYDQWGTEKETLLEIRTFCGKEALSVIEGENNPHRAWKKLEQKYDVESGIKAGGENYADWRRRVKDDLIFQNLWDVIESSPDPNDQEDDVVTSETRRGKNSRALEVIRIYCGWKELSAIKGTSSAERAWNILAEVYDKPVNRFIKAVKSEDRETIEKLLTHHPRLKIDKITNRDETALHVAVLADKEQIVELLLERIQSMERLCTFDNQGYTALGQAIFRDKRKMVECILRKKKGLINVQVAHDRIPVVLAIEHGKKEMACYLYKQTPPEVLKENKGIYGATLCTQAIYNKMLDIALNLIKNHQRLTLAVDVDGRSPMYALASMLDVFLSGKHSVFFNHSDQKNHSTPAVDETRLSISENIQSYESDEQVNIQSEQVKFSNAGFKSLEEKKSLDLAPELLRCMCKQIPMSSDEDMNNGVVSSVVDLATREGLFEFIDEIMKINDATKWSVDPKGRTILANAVLHRQTKIFKRLLESPEKKAMINSLDYKKNNILHMAGMLPPPSQLDRIPGAAMQMRYELRWFKYVESLVRPSMIKAPNTKGLTPRELFEKKHRDLRKEGEKSMKNTATSGTVVCALIVTIMFTALFQVPGGYIQETRLPLLLHEKAFKIFMFCISVSLVSSSTSALVFLEIISSRCAQEDFHKSLPRKMMVGLFTLSLSIAATAIVFFATLVLTLRGQSSLLIPIICVVGLQAILFVMPKICFVIDFLRAYLEKL